MDSAFSNEVFTKRTNERMTQRITPSGSIYLYNFDIIPHDTILMSLRMLSQYDKCHFKQLTQFKKNDEIFIPSFIDIS